MSRLKVAFFDFACCEGCQLQVYNMEEEILEFCKENMAGYKRPKIVEFRETLPVSNVGKILRRVLRDEELEKTK